MLSMFTAFQVQNVCGCLSYCFVMNVRLVAGDGARWSNISESTFLSFHMLINVCRLFKGLRQHRLSGCHTVCGGTGL